MTLAEGALHVQGDAPQDMDEVVWQQGSEVTAQLIRSLRKDLHTQEQKEARVHTELEYRTAELELARAELRERSSFQTLRGAHTQLEDTALLQCSYYQSGGCSPSTFADTHMQASGAARLKSQLLDDMKVCSAEARQQWHAAESNIKEVNH